MRLTANTYCGGDRMRLHRKKHATDCGCTAKNMLPTAAAPQKTCFTIRNRIALVALPMASAIFLNQALTSDLEDGV